MADTRTGLGGMQEILRRLTALERRRPLPSDPNTYLPGRLGPVGKVVEDANLATQAGFYAVSNAALNIPMAAEGVLLVEFGPLTGYVQTYHRTGSTTGADIVRTWRRRGSATGSWTAWFEVAPLASTAEVRAGTDAAKSVTPATLLAATNLGNLDATALPVDIPGGFSLASTGSGWPTTLGTIMNVKHSGFRQFQLFVSRDAPAKVWLRAANGDSAWQSFTRIIMDTDTATDAAPGIIEIATQDEVNAGTDATRAVTPATLQASPLSPFAGMMQMFAGATAPTGWMLCQGQTLLIADYPALYAVIGKQYGGNGTTNFMLPDMRGRVPVGLSTSDAEFNALGKSGGAKTHTLAQGEIPAHSHGPGPNSDGFVVHATGGGGYQAVFASGANGEAMFYRIPQINTPNGGAHNNLQPYVTINYIIKV